MDLTSLSLSDARSGIENGNFSSVDLVEACLARINTYDSALHTFISVDAERALSAAKEADRLCAAGVEGQALLGIPIAVKDLYDVTGSPTTAGSPLRQDVLPESDSFVIQRIKAHGGIIIGKTNLNEWAVGATGENEFFGPVQNPWDQNRISGGSSSGSASALAAGFCPLALGSDSGGSIRIPAALCGVVGMKPSYGRVSLNGVLPLSWTLDHAGPLARTVSDVATLLAVIAGPDPNDARTWALPVDGLRDHVDSSISGWRIALPDMSPFNACVDEVNTAMDQVKLTLQSLGAHPVNETIDWVLDAREKNRTIIAVESGVLHHDEVETQPDKFSPQVLERLRRGRNISSAEYAQALLHRLELRQACRSLFDRVDLLITPTTPVIAPRLVAADEMAYAREHLSTFLGAFNLSGLPAISIPWALSPDGLPIGIQLIGGDGQDRKVLIAAQAIEIARGFHGLAPL